MSSPTKTTGGIGPTSSFEWGEYFPHPHPYYDQVKAIRQFRAIADDGGYYVFEGPCGSGKTTIALTAALSSIERDDCPAKKVAAVTPLRNQRAQFMTELKSINQARLDGSRFAVPALEVGGKHEYLPFARETVGAYASDTESAYELSAELKETSMELLRYTSPYEIPIEWYTESDTTKCSHGSCSNSAPEDLGVCYTHADAFSAEEVGLSSARARAVLSHLAERQHGKDRLTVTIGDDEYETPYAAEIPYASDVAELTDVDMDARFDPFRIGYYTGADHGGDFESGGASVLTIEELVEHTAPYGVCPYRVLYDLLWFDDAASPTVVVGNYQHILNPRSQFLFNNYRGDDTFLIIDEAHELAEAARGELGSARALTALSGADAEWEHLLDLLQASTQTTEAKEILEKHGYSRRGVISDFKKFFKRVQDVVVDLAEIRINEEFYTQLPTTASELENRSELSLTEIGDESDRFTDAIRPIAESNEVWEDAFENLSQVEAVLKDLYKLIATDDDPYSSTAAAARFLNKWVHGADRDTYLREIVVEKRDTTPGGVIDGDLSRVYNASLSLYSTIPNTALYNSVFNVYGGGIVMSATLAPLDQFTAESGLDIAEGSGRTVVTDTFDMRFDRENRQTWVVDNGRYLHRHRKPVTKDPAEKSGTRKYYEDTLAEVAQTRGNHLYVMPSAREADVMGDALQKNDDVAKPVFIDVPGEDALSRFIEFPSEAIFVTYMNGTATTGVDFSGDLLHLVAVVGVSYPRLTDRTNALQAVYERELGDGWKYGMSVPAVRKTRQALGRVIRGSDEAGVRLLIDERYQNPKSSELDCFPNQLLGELDVKSRNELRDKIEGFWSFHYRFS